MLEEAIFAEQPLGLVQVERSPCWQAHFGCYAAHPGAAPSLSEFALNVLRRRRVRGQRIPCESMTTKGVAKRHPIRPSERIAAAKGPLSSAHVDGRWSNMG